MSARVSEVASSLYILLDRRMRASQSGSNLVCLSVRSVNVAQHLQARLETARSLAHQRKSISGNDKEQVTSRQLEASTLIRMVVYKLV